MARYRFDLEQKTPEWYFERLGKLSGSDFHVFLGDSAAKQDKIWEKISERKWMDTDSEEFFSPYTERGSMLEHEARRIYSATYEVPVREVGLVEEDGEFDTWAVCSPDGLVGDDGIIEIKCLVAKYHNQYTTPSSKKYGYISPQYKTQVQFNLLVTGRKWCDFIYYHPRAGLFVKRIEPDPKYQEKIKVALREAIKTIEENL